jgi:ABC-2 type transport system ATP-binding protein
MMMDLLQVEQLRKEYRGGVVANDSITLSVEPGEVYGLLGPNGAGKTTLVNQIVGLVKPTAGAITLNGVDVVTNPNYARQACSYQPQSQVPIDGLTMMQAITLVGRIRGGRSLEVARRAEQLVESLEIVGWADKSGQQLSGGVRRLVAFCMAAVAPGKLIILDEPTNDVDPLRRRLLWKEVRALAGNGSSVLLVTHNVLEAERSVNRLAIIDHGRVVASGTPASLKESEAGAFRLELVLEPGAVLPQLPPFVTTPLAAGRRLIGRVEAERLGQVVDWATDLRMASVIEEFSVGPTTLEDVYVRKIGRAGVPGGPTKEINHVVHAQLAA